MAVIRKNKVRGSANLQRLKAGSIDDAKNALRIAEKHGIQTEPLNVRQLIDTIGITLKVSPMENHISGYLKNINGKWVIAINSRHHPRRRRFTMAHELAHFFLHSSEKDQFVDRVLFRDNTSDRMEWEANQFAGELLMPEERFLDLIRTGKKKVEEIAEQFGVSALAVRVRAKQLGLGGHGL